MRMMTAALIAATLFAASATPAAARDGAYDSLTAGFSPKTGKYCIRSGWGSASAQTGRLVRAGDCGTAAAWRRRGIAFDQADLATRQPRTPAAERLAAR